MVIQDTSCHLTWMDCLRTFKKAIHRCSNIFSPDWVILYFITQVVNPMTNPISCIGHPAFNIISLFISRNSNLLITKIFSYWILSHPNSKVTPWVYRWCGGTSELGNEVHTELKYQISFFLMISWFNMTFWQITDIKMRSSNSTNQNKHLG